MDGLFGVSESLVLHAADSKQVGTLIANHHPRFHFWVPVTLTGMPLAPHSLLLRGLHFL